MTASHHTAAEIARLAAALGRPAADLEFLAALPPSALRTFREQISDRISAREARRMQKTAAAAALVPPRLAAKITEAAFGPVLAAAIAGSVDPARAVAIASALSPIFLADVAVTLDPRRAAEVIAEIPDRMAADVARELLGRRDYLTMGRLAASVPDDVLRVALPHAADIDLLHVGYHLDDPAAADRLLSLITDRVPGLIQATNAQGHWPEAIALLDTLGPTERSRLADEVAAEDTEILDGLLTTVTTLDAWDTLLPVAAGMKPEGLRRLAARPSMQDPAVLTTIADLALTHDLWLDLLPLAEHLTATQLRTVAARISTEPDDVLTTLIEQARNHWETLFPVALALEPDARRRFASLPVVHRSDTLTTAVTTAATHDLWAEALPLLGILPDATHDTLATAIADLSDDNFIAAIAAAPAADCTTTLVRIALRQDATARSRSLALLDESGDVEALVATFTPTDSSVWEAVVDIRSELPDRLRHLLAVQAKRCEQNEFADLLSDGR
ncbi:hypothetical protein [Nocardia caishijiensis]|uniref:Leucine rich repeat (LRR) protein n=1 Tax=Nocardia caishijiensis TaxID=184756 RepID=A0ABQ6YG11_9NOCA|nr:hypothetical protein [Nocardia caishijiensis]KAF0842559.1 hypothetical protein FNL39_111140 [Nocardia caishijiensis]